jgi:hypothetical protein
MGVVVLLYISALLLQGFELLPHQEINDPMNGKMIRIVAKVPGS